MMKQRSSRKGTRKGSKIPGGGGQPRQRLNPPQLSSNVRVSHTYRFRSTSGTTLSLTESDLISVAGGVCSVANATCSLIAGSVKVHRVSIWTPPASQGAVATCSLNWRSPTYQQTQEISDTTISVTTPARVSSRPPLGSAASFWLSPAGNAIVDVTAPVGSIIDLHCTHVLQDNQAAGTAYSVAAGTLGVLYYFPLDGEGDAYLPVSLGTTT